MRKYSAWACIGSLSLVVLAGCGNIPFFPGWSDSIQKDYAISLAADGITTLKVNWRMGDIEIRVDEQAEDISVTGVKKVTSPTEDEAEDGLEYFDITIEIDDSDATQANLQFTAPTVAWTVFQATAVVVLPADLTLDITSNFGDLEVRDNVGAGTIKLNAGELRVNNYVGDLDVEVDAGDLTFANVQGNLVINVDHGNVTVENLTGNLQAEVDAGDIEVDSEGGDVDLDFKAGDIKVDASPAENGTIRIRNDYGSIDLRVPSTFAASLSLSTDFGEVDASLAAFDASDVNTDANDATATLNGGGGEIDVRTDFGDIDFDDLP